MFSWIYNVKKNKWKLWYLIAIAIILAFALWGLIMGLYAMTIVVLLLAWVYFLVENNSNNDVTVIIDEAWVTISNTFYSYSQLDYFAIIHSWNRPLLLRIKHKWNNSSFTDVYLIEWLNISEIRIFLSDYIQEKSNVEMTFVEMILYMLKI